jgi:hypothetical protein
MTAYTLLPGKSVHMQVSAVQFANRGVASRVSRSRCRLAAILASMTSSRWRASQPRAKTESIEKMNVAYWNCPCGRTN